MLPFSSWVLVVYILGIIAAGIGLAYLLIFLFWRTKGDFYLQPIVRSDIQPEVKIEEPSEQLEPEEEQILEKDSQEEISLIAYDIWEQEGRYHGRDVQHWLMAEEIWQKRRSSPGKMTGIPNTL